MSVYQTLVVPYMGKGCLIWPFTRTDEGYGQLWVGGRHVYVHRWACEARNGQPPTPKHEAAHSCGNGHLGCVNPGHLVWKTRAQNAADAVAHGTASRGEKHGCAILTERQVQTIRLLKDAGNSRDLAELFGVSRSTIQHIHSGRKWAHLPVASDEDLESEARRLAARIQEKK